MSRMEKTQQQLNTVVIYSGGMDSTTLLCYLKVGDEVNFGPFQFRIFSFGSGAVVLHAQPGTHIAKRKT